MILGIILIILVATTFALYVSMVVRSNRLKRAVVAQVTRLSRDEMLASTKRYTDQAEENLKSLHAAVLVLAEPGENPSDKEVLQYEIIQNLVEEIERLNSANLDVDNCDNFVSLEADLSERGGNDAEN